MAVLSSHRSRRAARPAPIESAKAAGLRYVTDEKPGFTRKRVGDGFIYFNATGRRITNRNVLARIQSLAIPPAWTDVWICPLDSGHLQASGRDARGRKQYRYHPKWRQTRDGNKYDRMCAFGKLLPTIRRVTGRHLAQPGLGREKVLAAIIRVMSETFMRVGNEEYAKSNHSYGLTTLKDQHAHIHGGDVHFHFRGKSGIEHEIDLHDPKLAKIVKACRDLPGQDLFQFRDSDGVVHDIKSEDVNQYLRDITGQDVTAKDFRTWAGTMLAARALCAVKDLPTSQAVAKRNIVAAIKEVAEQLGNTAAVCRKCYVHPGVLDAFIDGTLRKHFASGSEENGLLSLLKARAKTSDARAKAA